MFQGAVARRAARRERERICLALEIAADRAQAECTVEPSCDVLRDAAGIIRANTVHL
jgi:hypothetical protein